MKIRTTAAALGGLLLMALPSFAQITTLEGVVTGTDGNPSAGSRHPRSCVSILRRRNLHSVKTDKKGHYIYNGLMGTYDISCVVDCNDVDKDHQNGIKTSPTANKIVNFDLKVAAEQAAAIQKAASRPARLTKDQERGMSRRGRGRRSKEYYAKHEREYQEERRAQRSL
jgi:hypothetical protein